MLHWAQGLGEEDRILVEQMDDVIRVRLKEVLIIKKADYMVVMRSAFWAQGWWFAEDPVLSGLLQQRLEHFCLKRLFIINLSQGRGSLEGIC